MAERVDAAIMEVVHAARGIKFDAEQMAMNMLRFFGSAKRWG